MSDLGKAIEALLNLKEQVRIETLEKDVQIVTHVLDSMNKLLALKNDAPRETRAFVLGYLAAKRAYCPSRDQLCPVDKTGEDFGYLIDRLMPDSGE